MDEAGQFWNLVDDPLLDDGSAAFLFSSTGNSLALSWAELWWLMLSSVLSLSSGLY